MGACYDAYGCRAETDQEAIAKCDSYVDQQRAEYGYDAYSGTMATCHGGIRVLDRKFDDSSDAHEWLQENTSKRGTILGVKVKHTEGDYYLFGAMCAE